MTKALGPKRGIEAYQEARTGLLEAFAAYKEIDSAEDTFRGRVELRLGFEGDSDTEIDLEAEAAAPAIAAAGGIDASASAGLSREKRRAHDNELAAWIEITSAGAVLEKKLEP